MPADRQILFFRCFPSPVTNLPKVGLALFALGVIMFLTNRFIPAYLAQLSLLISGTSDLSIIYNFAFYSPFVLIVAGLIAFYIGRRQKNSEPATGVFPSDKH